MKTFMVFSTQLKVYKYVSRNNNLYSPLNSFKLVNRVISSFKLVQFCYTFDNDCNNLRSVFKQYDNIGTIGTITMTIINPITRYLYRNLNVLSEERLKECGLTTLETRRLRENQIEVFRILNGYENIYKYFFSDLRKIVGMGVMR